jgi:hypothetical protein
MNLAAANDKISCSIRRQELIAHGDAQTFEDAKAAAERAFGKL